MKKRGGWGGFALEGLALAVHGAQAMKTGRGWWALAGMGTGSVLLLLVGYVGAYVALVEPVVMPSFGTSLMRSPPFPPIPTYPSAWMRRFFDPAHQIDRRLRPHVWDPP